MFFFFFVRAGDFAIFGKCDLAKFSGHLALEVQAAKLYASFKISFSFFSFAKTSMLTLLFLSFGVNRFFFVFLFRNKFSTGKKSCAHRVRKPTKQRHDGFFFLLNPKERRNILRKRETEREREKEREREREREREKELEGERGGEGERQRGGGG